MSYLSKLATMLGIGEHQAEDALHSERTARAVLTRRNLFAASAAMATGSVFSFVTPTELAVARIGDLVEAGGAAPLSWESILLKVGDDTWSLGSLPVVSFQGATVRLRTPFGATVSVSTAAVNKPGDVYSLPVPVSLGRVRL